MGTLEYATAGTLAEMDDRTLAHLQIVICNKLRRNERFTLTVSPRGRDDGAVAVVWLAASLPLRFLYSSPDPQRINPAWLHVLADAAASSGGLRMLPEPAPRHEARRQPALV